MQCDLEKHFTIIINTCERMYLNKTREAVPEQDGDNEGCQRNYVQEYNGIRRRCILQAVEG